MRKVRLVCDGFGDVKKYEDCNDYFSQESNEVQVEVTFPSEFSSYRKRLDIYVDYDQSIDYFEDDVDTKLVVTLTNEHLKQGEIKLQPIAYLFVEGQEYVNATKQKWEVESIEVEYSLNVGESTINVSQTLGEQLQEQIDDLQTQIDDLTFDDLMQVDGSNSNVNVLVFDTTVTETTLLAGEMQYSQTDGTVNLGMNGGQVTQSIGLESYYRVVNNSGVTINDGDLVMYNGTSGASGKTYIKKWDTTSPEFTIMGIATETMNNGSDGFVTWHGLVKGVNSTGSSVGETWATNDVLYPSLTHVGGLTKVPNSMQPVVANMFSQSVNGIFLVRCR